MNGIYRFIYTDDKPLMMNIGGFIFLVFGAIILIGKSIFFGALVFVISVLVILYQSGIEVDFENRRYRETNNFGPIVVGSWEPLPPLQYVSVFTATKVTVATSNTGRTVDPSERVLQVNLITKNNRRIKLYEGKDRERAFDLAKRYAPRLGLDVWDATTKEGKWLEV